MLRTIVHYSLHLLAPGGVAAVYAAMCVLPYERLGWKWWLRAVGIGLTLHILTDWQDYVLWKN